MATLLIILRRSTVYHVQIGTMLPGRYWEGGGGANGRRNQVQFKEKVDFYNQNNKYNSLGKVTKKKKTTIQKHENTKKKKSKMNSQGTRETMTI